MTFRETLRSILKGMSYEFRGGDPHVHLNDVLTIVQAKKAGTYQQVVSDHNKIRGIPNQFGLSENGLSIESRLYQSAARILQKVSPNSIGKREEDGTIWLDSGVEYKPAENIHKLSPDGRAVLGSMFYLAGIGELIDSVDNSIDLSNIDSGIKSLRDAAVLLPNEKSVMAAIEKADEIKRAAMSEAKSAGKSGCFIATAVYGNSTAAEVIYLQRYRDDILSRTKTGRSFIKTYYRISPSLALLVRKSTLLKITIRNFVLDPLIALLRRIYKIN